MIKRYIFITKIVLSLCILHNTCLWAFPVNCHKEALAPQSSIITEPKKQKKKTRRTRPRKKATTLPKVTSAQLKEIKKIIERKAEIISDIRDNMYRVREVITGSLMTESENITIFYNSTYNEKELFIYCSDDESNELSNYIIHIYLNPKTHLRLGRKVSSKKMVNVYTKTRSRLRKIKGVPHIHRIGPHPTPLDIAEDKLEEHLKADPEKEKKTKKALLALGFLLDIDSGITTEIHSGDIKEWSKRVLAVAARLEKLKGPGNRGELEAYRLELKTESMCKRLPQAGVAALEKRRAQHIPLHAFLDALLDPNLQGLVHKRVAGVHEIFEEKMQGGYKIRRIERGNNDDPSIVCYMKILSALEIQSKAGIKQVLGAVAKQSTKLRTQEFCKHTIKRKNISCGVNDDNWLSSLVRIAEGTRDTETFLAALSIETTLCHCITDETVTHTYFWACDEDHEMLYGHVEGQVDVPVPFIRGSVYDNYVGLFRKGRRLNTDKLRNYITQMANLLERGEGIAEGINDREELVEFLTRPPYTPWLTKTKVIAIDGDGTLWKNSLDSVNFDHNKIAVPKSHQNFQRELKRICAKRGIYLVLLTKNPPEAQEAVNNLLEHHPKMVLRKEDFTAIRVGYEDKSKNLQEILQDELGGIGPEAVMFLDDKREERLAMEQIGAFVPELPTASRRWTTILKGYERDGLFGSGETTKEDQQREPRLAAAKRMRALLKQEDKIENVFKKLKMQMAIEVDDRIPRIATPSTSSNQQEGVDKTNEEHLQRIANLSQTTNQLNMLGRKYNKTDIEKFSHDDNYLVFACELTKPEAGTNIEGMMIWQRDNKDRNTWNLRDLCLSCTGFGFGEIERIIERDFMMLTIQYLQQRGARKLRGFRIPTQRNKVINRFFSRYKFRRIKFERDYFPELTKGITPLTYELDLREYPIAFTGHIKIITTDPNQSDVDEAI